MSTTNSSLLDRSLAHKRQKLSEHTSDESESGQNECPMPSSSYVGESPGLGGVIRPQDAPSCTVSDFQGAYEASHISNTPRTVPSIGSADQNVSYKPPIAVGTDDLADEATSPQLSDEQAEVARLVAAHHNVFFTGNAGTGKSFLLNHIVNQLRGQYEEDFQDSVAICASTGIAATHIGGTTVHSAFGIGVPRVKDDFGKVWKESNKLKLRALKVLVIDEISMISGELFEHLERHTRQLRGNRQPFGGLQIVLCGDYFQLPPIQDSYDQERGEEAFLNRGYTFQAPAWTRCKMEQRVLTKVFRQKDQAFVNILESIRYNQRAQEALKELFLLCGRPLPDKEGIEPTSLFSNNRDVNNLNNNRIKALEGDEVVMAASDGIETAVESENAPDKEREYESELWRADFFKSCLAEKEVRLKVGAQVMLLWNKDLTGGSENMLVNGSRGVVTGFKARSEVADNQPKSEDEPENWETCWNGRSLPVVRFLSGRETVVTPEKFTSEVPVYGLCKRMQVPLKLAWAITIHKSQGMTLDYVKVSLRNIFAQGQCYVALSRASSMAGLQVIDPAPNCVKINQLVMHFHKCVMEGEEYVEKDWESLMELPPHFSRRNPGSPSPVKKTTFAEVPGPSPNPGRKFGRGRWGGPEGRAANDNRSGSWGSQRSNDRVVRNIQDWGGAVQRSQGPTNRGGGAYQGGQTGARGYGGGRDKSNDVCYHCKQTGHWSSNCPSKRR